MGKVQRKARKAKSPAVKQIESRRLVGRPKRLDIGDAYMVHQLKTLGEIHCTMQEVAALFRVSVSSLHEWFERCPEARAIYEQGKAEGKMSLRRSQFRMAQKNPVMSIWLGKNTLDQTDKAETKVTQQVDVNVRHSVHELFDKIDQMAERGKALMRPGDGAKPVN